MTDDAYVLCGWQDVRKLVRRHLLRVADGDARGHPRNRLSPILILEGPPGSGKTAVLDSITGDLVRTVPFARFDFSPVPPEPGNPRKSVAAEIDSALTAMVWELSQWRPIYGSLRFHRFAIAQLVRRLDLDLAEPAEHLRRKVITELEHERGVDTLRQVLRDAATQAGDRIPGPLGWSLKTLGPYAVQRGFDRLASRMSGRRLLLGRHLQWYRDRGQGNDIDVLVNLNRWARADAGPASQARATQLIFAAFFADLRDNFQHGRRSGEWSFNSVLFLENITSKWGSAFLEELAAARVQHCAAVDDGDPLTVVATTRTRVPVEGTPVVRAILRPLDLATVSGMADARSWVDGDIRGLATRIHAFTGGHPESVDVLLDAAVQHGTADVELNDLLAWRPDNGADSVSPNRAELLLDRLLPDALPEEVDDLVTLSAARDRSHAVRLARRANLLSESRHSSAPRPDLWVTDNAGGQMLRRLLLRRLAARELDHRANWLIVHDALRRFCREAGPGDKTGELYHALAGGDLTFVVTQLAELAGRVNTGAWLELLKSVSAAPRRPCDRPPGDQVKELVSEVRTPDERVAALAHVVAGLWVLDDPAVPGKLNRVHKSIAKNYDAMADLTENPEMVEDEADKHREERNPWQ